MTTYIYQVIDSQTHHIVGEYKTSRRARNRAEKLNQEYGAVRYSTVFIEASA